MSNSSTHRKTFGDGLVELVNLKEVPEEEWTVYIGRENSYYNLSESIFSNPYSTEDYQRETAVRLYTLWFFEQFYSSSEFREKFQDLRDETLACWCLPDACHGAVLCKALVAFEKDEFERFVEDEFVKIEASLFGFRERVATVKQKLVEQDVFSN